MKFLSSVELPQKTEQWRRDLEVQPNSRLDVDDSALLVLDMQREFLAQEGLLPVWGGPAIIPNVVALVSAFRQADLPVIFTRHICLEPFKHRNLLGIMKEISEPASLLRNGSVGADFDDNITPLNGELVVTKYRYSAFYDTALGTVLRVNRSKKVIITGVATNICCETTAHDAFFRGYDVLFVLDATGGTDETAHLASLRNICLSYGKVVTTKQVIDSLQSK